VSVKRDPCRDALGDAIAAVARELLRKLDQIDTAGGGE
jgi:hypothetical protein